LSGIGATHAPQPEITADDRDKLGTMWATVLRSGGATVDLDPSTLPDSKPADGLPPVTPITLHPTAPTRGTVTCVKFREDQIGFLPDSAEVRDPAAALAALTPIAKVLASQGLTATVVGTTAVPENSPYPLSLARATKVVSLLGDLHVPKTSLTPIGVGIHFSGFVPDTNADGQLIETLAVQNRLVIIQPVGQQCQ
jgi:hypothetical protein